MKIKVIGGKKINIKKFSEKDIKKSKGFLKYINGLIDEQVKIVFNKKSSLKEERIFLKQTWRTIKGKKMVMVFVEYNKEIVAVTNVTLEKGRQEHVGYFGINIRRDFRGMGLGELLTKYIINLAKNELKPRPSIIRLSVYANNKPAIRLYEKIGFKKVAVVPKQFNYKGGLINENIMLLYL